MASSDNFVTLNGSTWSLNCDQRRPTSVPLFCDNKDNRGKNFEDFLKDSGCVQPVVKNGDFDGVIDFQSMSSMSLPRELDDNNEEELDEGKMNTTGPMVQADALDVQTSTNDQIDTAQKDVTPTLTNDTIPAAFDTMRQFERDIQVATPIITIHQSKPRRSENDRLPSPENPSEFQRFSDQLHKLSETIEQKDEEIKKLSKKLLELKDKASDTKRTPAHKSPVSSSDDKRKDKKKKKSEEKSDATLKGKKGKNIKNKNEKDIPNKCNDPVKDTSVIKTTELPSIVKTPEVVNDGEIIPNMRQKLSDLEDKVKHLQQANVDSIMSLQRFQKHEPSHSKPSSDGVIRQLLLDHSILKEEFDQLRLAHDKLAQPCVFEEEINQLKHEVNELQNQNDVLHQHIKSLSTNSLNLVPNLSVLRKSSEKISDKYKDYFETPHTKNYQSVNHGAPLNSAEKFPARKFSDSSSTLMEDVTAKFWMKPSTVNETRKHSFPSKYREVVHVEQDYTAFDDCSEDSFVTVDDTEDGWKYLNRNPQQNNGDLLSTLDTDTSYETNELKVYESKLRPSYSFTPKSANDLHLEDLVKFARPGGKMSTGRVCFVGHLPGHRENCVGIELDEEAGKHDGKFEGIRYFQCRRNRGVFISFHKIILAYKHI